MHFSRENARGMHEFFHRLFTFLDPLRLQIDTHWRIPFFDFGHALGNTLDTLLHLDHIVLYIGIIVKGHGPSKNARVEVWCVNH